MNNKTKNLLDINSRIKSRFFLSKSINFVNNDIASKPLTSNGLGSPSSIL